MIESKLNGFLFFFVTFGLRNFHRGGEMKYSSISYVHYYVLILNYFRGRLAVLLSIPVEFTHGGFVLIIIITSAKMTFCGGYVFC